MAVALSSFKKKNVIETFKKVKNIRETSSLTKISRNTVRKILREIKIDNLATNEAMNASRNMADLKKIPLINPKSKWNPIPSEVYRRLAKIEPISAIEPGCVDFITNTSLLMASLAQELQLGASVVATFKLDILMSYYIEWKKLLHQASAINSTNSNLPADKLAKTVNSYRDAANKALGRVIELLSELEGKKSTGGHLTQTNINVNLEGQVYTKAKHPIDIEP